MDITDAAALGAALQRARYAARLSQRDLAKRLGISQRYVVEIESGKPSLYSARLFAYLTAVGARLSIEDPDPGTAHGYRALWPRPALPKDAASLHEVDATRSEAEWADAGAGGGILVTAGAIDWPRGTHIQARRAFATELLGYREGDRIVLRADLSDATAAEAEDVLRSAEYPTDGKSG